MGTLDGKGALVTGGSRGIGRAIVRRLAAEGATVVLTYSENERAADKVVTENKEQGRAVTAVQADQADLAGLPELFATAADSTGGLDILVINAAINLVKPIEDTTEADYDRLMAVNAKGPFFTIQQAGRVLRDGGRIITFSTLNTVIPAPRNAVYIASKAAIEQFTAVAAREFGPRGITVNCVSPGATDTELLRASNPDETFEAVKAMTALGRLGEPADVADVVAFLAGPDSHWITGQNLRVTGGLLI
jgi:3-oxoacyl-[acyl-carrier protein] reductase